MTVLFKVCVGARIAVGGIKPLATRIILSLMGIAIGAHYFPVFVGSLTLPINRILPV